MTEKTTPELPFTLAEDSDGDELILEEALPEGNTDGTHFIRVVSDTSGTDGIYIDPAELMRNLAAFVPEVEPVAWQDKDGDVWEAGAKETADQYAPLVPLYAHPPVTAEPAQSFHEEVMLDARRQAEERVRELEAENNRLKDALSTNSDDALCICITGGPAMEGPDEYCLTHGRTKADLLKRLGAANQLIRELEAEVADESETRGNLANRVTEVENIARAELERYKVALEAADALLSAKDDVDETESEVRRVIKAKDEAIDERDLARASYNEAFDAYSAARAAVEAETSEPPTPHGGCMSIQCATCYPGLVEAATSEEAGDE